MPSTRFKLTEDSLLGKAGQYVELDMRTGEVRTDGRRVHLALTPTDVITSAEIPTFVAGYANGLYRADEVSPPILVDKSIGKYRIRSADDAFRAVNVKASMQQAVPEVDPVSSVVEYSVVERLLGTFIPDITDENAAGTAYRPRIVAAKRISNAVKLDREIDVAALLTTSGNWDSDNVAAIAAGAKWNGGASSDPLADLQGRIEASLQEPTDIWFNRRVGNAFLRHPSVRDQMRQMGGDKDYLDIAKKVENMKAGTSVDFMIPGLPPFHVLTAKVKNDTTGAMDYVWGNHVVLTVSVPSPVDDEDIATTYTYRRKGTQGVGFDTREYRVEGRGNGGTMIACSMGDVAKFIANDVGGLLTNAWQ